MTLNGFQLIVGNQNNPNHIMQFYSFSVKENDQRCKSKTKMQRNSNLLKVEEELGSEVSG